MTRISIAAALLVLCAAPALAASSTDQALFGKDPGADRAFACYTRHYDKAHLKGHPHQNVTDMSLLVNSYLEDQRYYDLSIGVNFRKVANPFNVSGSCSGAVAAGGLLHCGVDCDGGQIDVRLKDANSILVDIPDGARVWDPNQPDDADPDAGVGPDAHFGPDDKTFLLSRAPLASCVDLVNDDDRQLLLAAGK